VALYGAKQSNRVDDRFFGWLSLPKHRGGVIFTHHETFTQT
jgi:hypothetical protein